MTLTVDFRIDFIKILQGISKKT